MSEPAPPRSASPPPTAASTASPTSAQHRAEAPRSVECAIVTVSDTRTVADDRSGALIAEILAAAGHVVRSHVVVKDEPVAIRQALDDAADTGTIRAVLLDGGTGIAPRDNTYETLSALLEKRLDGFGEIFRVLSFHEIGPPAMLSRAVAGTYRRMIVFSMPGSTNAVRLAMEKLIAPELAHAIRELDKRGAAT